MEPALHGLMKEFELIILGRSNPFKGGCFKLVAGLFGSSNLRATVRAARGSAAVPAGSFGWAMTAGGTRGVQHTQLAVNSDSWESVRCDTDLRF